MNDDTASALAEGEALPPVSPSPAKAGFFSRAEQAAKTDAERVIAAIERWYAAHFHAAAVSGRAPITADDKAALLKHVAEAVAPTAPKE
jgi:hypothetical protein